MRDYGRVFCALWRSQDFRSLTEDGRALVQYLLTSPHGTLIGAFSLPDGYVCEDIQWTKERVREGFEELFVKGFARRCELTQWVWIRKYLEWNQPDNPNQWKAARKLADKVPQSCAWAPEFHEDFGEAFDFYEAEKSAGRSNRSGTLSKQGTGTGEGSGKGVGTGTVVGTGTGARASDLNGHAPTELERPEDFSGERSPPQEPSRRRSGSAERRNGDFESINDAVSRVLAEGGVKPGEYKAIAKMAGISTLQAEIAVRQLRDRGRLPSVAA